MNIRASTLLSLLLVIAVCTTMLHASEIPLRAVYSHHLVVGDPPVSGSFPFTAIIVSETGGDNLRTATTLDAAGTLTTGFGRGEFSPALVGLETPFGPFTLTVTEISTGGGFSISNGRVGTFDATGGSISNETPTSLVVDLTGTFDPGPALIGEPASSAHTTLSFTQRDGSIAASGVLETTIPEPGTLVTMGMGLCSTALMLRRKPRHKSL